jgi:hypothetical protein
MDHDRRLIWLAWPCATVAACAAILGTGDDLTFRSGMDAGASDSGAADANDSGTVAETSATGWTAGPSTTWSHSNILFDQSLDCCGCACGPCTDNTLVAEAPDGGLWFTSGPPISGGTGHQSDGFAAWPTDGVPVAAGKSNLLTFDLVALGASISGSVGTETGAEYKPHWSVSIRDGQNVIGGIGDSWGTPQCQSCSVTQGPTLGTQRYPFSPKGERVDIVFSAGHHSSQCDSEVHDVFVQVASVRVTAE